MDDNLGGVLALVALGVAEVVVVLVAKLLGWEAPRDKEQAEREAAFEEAMLARERRDPVPRSDAVRLLRRQMPLGLSVQHETASMEAVGRLVSGGGIGARNSGAA